MFNRNSFSPVSFSLISFHGLRRAEEGKSGYWRLFYTQMQEEALKNRNAILTPEPREEANEQVERQATPPRARKSKKRPEPLVELEEYPEVRFKRKPIYTNPQPVVEQFPLWLADISIEINSWLTTVIPAWEARKQAIIVQKQEAANDADMRLRILLLAA